MACMVLTGAQFTCSESDTRQDLSTQAVSRQAECTNEVSNTVVT